MMALHLFSLLLDEHFVFDGKSRIYYIGDINFVKTGEINNIINGSNDPNLRKHGIEGHISHLNLTYLKTFEIPLPLLSTQQAIVSEIKAEQALVVANRELIEQFEKEIRAAIA